MWLKNYIAYLWYYGIYALSYSSAPVRLPFNLKNYQGTITQTVTPVARSANTLPDRSYVSGFVAPFTGVIGSTTYTTGSSPYTAGVGVLFGSGTTPVSNEDYKLDSIITSGLSFASGVAFGSDEGVIAHTVTATATTDITIGEVGLAQNGYLLYRMVLDSPVNLSAGESVTVTVKTNISTGGMTVNM